MRFDITSHSSSAKLCYDACKGRHMTQLRNHWVTTEDRVIVKSGVQAIFMRRLDLGLMA